MGRGEGSGWGAQGGCERRIEVFGKIHQKYRGGREGGQVGVGLVGGQGGCLRRTEVFVKIKKKVGGGRGEGLSRGGGLVRSGWM